MNRIPRIQDPQHELSGCCKKPAGLKQLDRIHRTLPPQVFNNEDIDVLQDEDGAAVLDETTSNYIYDTFRNGGQFN
jgi:hypothetical protein